MLYLGRGISTGAGFYTEVALEYPVLIGYLMAAARGVTRLLGGQVSPEASHAEQVAASQIFFQVTAVALFGCFVVTVLAHLRMSGPVRAKDALLIAASPVVLAAGLINWDLLAVMLTSLGLWAWSRRLPVIAGGLFGLAFAAKFYPVLVLVAISVLCLRAARYRAAGQLWGAAAVAWLAVNVPVMVAAWDGWSEFWTRNAERDADLGSIWSVLKRSVSVPALSAIAFLRWRPAGSAGWCCAPARSTRRSTLWLLPLVVLARTADRRCGRPPNWSTSSGASCKDCQQAAITVLRCYVQLWFALRVVDDVMRPWEDPVRLPMVDEPIGGVLNHAPDAGWLAALQTRWAR